MPKTTSYSGIQLPDPNTDGNNTFNLEKIINEPIETIDAAVGVIQSTFAKKRPGQWIKATLLNGWNHVTGNEVHYRIDDTGFVEFKGAAYGGTIADDTIIFKIPSLFMPETEIYRPMANWQWSPRTFHPAITFIYINDVKILGVKHLDWISPVANYRAQLT